MEKKRIEFKFESGDGTGQFSGYGSIFGNTDSYGDVVAEGAFKRTIRAWEDKGKYPPMLLQHGGAMSGFGGTAMDGVPIGVWTSMKENARGLKVDGQLIAMDTPDIKRVYEAMKAGSLDGLSIGYTVKTFEAGTKPSEPRRKLTDLELWELSVVTFPSNDRSRVSGVKAIEMINGIDTLSDAEKFLREAGFSKSVSLDFVSRLSKIARREADDGQEVKNLLDRLQGLRELTATR